MINSTQGTTGSIMEAWMAVLQKNSKSEEEVMLEVMEGAQSTAEKVKEHTEEVLNKEDENDVSSTQESDYAYSTEENKNSTVEFEA